MVRSGLAASLVFAGVWLLAGAGWGLVAGGCLVFALWPQGAETALTRASRASAERARRLAGLVKAAPRRATAVGGMTAGVALLPLGLAVASGVGIAVAAGGALLIGVGLLTGWGA